MNTSNPNHKRIFTVKALLIVFTIWFVAQMVFLINYYIPSVVEPFSDILKLKDHLENVLYQVITWMVMWPLLVIILLFIELIFLRKNR